MRIAVHAGTHDRHNCPVYAKIPIVSSGGLALREEGTGQIVPVQWREAKAGSEVVWLLDVLPSGSVRTYEVLKMSDLSDRENVRLVDAAGQVEVTVGGELFTRYHYGIVSARPFLYPVIGPYGHGITRSYPMADDVPGEKHDHPHHRSLYTAFGDVNGVDDWSEGEGHGCIVHQGFRALECGPVYGRIEADNAWVSSQGELVVAETREMVFYATPPHARLIDYAVTFRAGDEPVTFGDTKEGGILSVRVATSMDVASGMGGRITNAYGGVDEEETWGQRSPWCDYSGPVAGRTVGIAVLDHPDNLRYPTQWHVRDYGLMTANCFGWSYYKGDPALDGSHTIPPQTDLAFRYRIYVHTGCAERVPAQFTNWTFPPKVSIAD